MRLQRFQRLKQNHTVVFLTFTTLACGLALTGCQGGIFKKPDPTWKRPSLSGLAFWKKGESQTLPPPPAHHFSPVAADGESTSVASAKPTKTSGSSNSKDADLQSKFNRLAESSQQQKEGLADDTRKQLDKSPIRTPYSTVKDAGAVADDSVTKAQSDFKAALASSNQALQNSMSASTASSKDVATSVKNDFQLPAGIAAEAQSKIAKAKNSFNPAAAQVNQKLYDASGSLATGVQKQAQQSASQFSQFGQSVSQPASGELKDVQDQVALAQQQIAELKKQVAEAKQQAAQLASHTTTAVNLASQASSQPLEHVARLNLPTANPSSNSAPKTQSAFQSQAFQSAAFQPQTGNFSPLDNLGSQSSGGMPSNVLRSGSPLTPMGGTGSGQSTPSSTQPISSGDSGNGYPSTPHGGYQPQSTNSNTLSNSTSNQFSVQPASLSSRVSAANDFGSGAPASKQSNVVQANGNVSVQSTSNSGVTTANHVSDIDIPLSVLRGSGSYAPGTVNRLLSK